MLFSLINSIHIATAIANYLKQDHIFYITLTKSDLSIKFKQERIKTEYIIIFVIKDHSTFEVSIFKLLNITECASKYIFHLLCKV